LGPYFEGQTKGSYCGLASAAIVMNALIQHEEREQIRQDELSLFVEENITFHHKMKYGLTLDQVATMLQYYGFHALIRSNSDPNELGKLLRNDLAKYMATQPSGSNSTSNTPLAFFICNFWRQFPDHRGGHFSPIAAFDPETDQLLLLDVATSRFPPHWIALQNLVPSMARNDSTVNRPRGYMLVSLHDLNEPSPSLEKTL
jgi:glutathione gamma-glutamylcysteinyltransferase